MESCTQSHDNAMATTTTCFNISHAYWRRWCVGTGCWVYYGRVGALMWKSAVTMYGTLWIRWFYGEAKTVVSLSTLYMYLLYVHILVCHSLSMLLKWIRRLRFVFCFETFRHSCFVYKWRTNSHYEFGFYISLLQHFRRLLLLFYKR